MSTPSTVPPPPSTRPLPRRFSLAEYKAHNDALEARYPDVGREHAARRVATRRREVREHLRVARRSQLADVRLAALEEAIELLISDDERGAK